LDCPQARNINADGFQFGGKKNKVLAVVAEILGDAATTPSEDDELKVEDEEMPLSTGSEAILDDSESRHRITPETGKDEASTSIAGARVQGGAAAISQSSPAALPKVGSASSSVQGVSISSIAPKTYSGSQGSVRQLSLVELARLQGVVQKGTLGRPRGLRPSLFSNVPPTVNFALHNTHAEEVPPFLKKHMRWKLSNLTPLVVRKVLGHSNLRLMKSDSTEWIGHWGKHMKAVMFKDFKAYQKINHFPGTFVIGRKDRLWRGFAQFRSKFGKNEFNFLPRTFILPNDLRELKESMDRKGSRGQNYIVKPPASARGTGVYVVNNYSAISAERQLVVQKYITRPFLINGTKFDLRLYIFVASYNPLRLYLYRDGLVRFASEKYNSSSRTLNHQFVHLTNYSINRKSGNYQANNSVNECQGHKWTLLAFWKFLRRLGVNTGLLWASIQDIVIKTIITSEATVNDMMERHVRSRYSTFELFGFDIILDETLKPWLLEVNISPSLHSSSALDEDVKGRMLRDLFNLMMLHIPASKLSREEEREVIRQCRLPPDSLVAHDPVLYTDELSRTERNKHDYYQTKNRRKDYLRTILSELTPDDIRQLIIAEDELARCGDYVRIFPTQYTYLYHRFFEKPRYYNLLLDAWEFHYHSDRLAGRLLLEHYCSKKYHLQFRKDVSYRRIHVQRLLSVPTNPPAMTAAAAAGLGAGPSSAQPDYTKYGPSARRESASNTTSARPVSEPAQTQNPATSSSHSSAYVAPQQSKPSPPSAQAPPRDAPQPSTPSNAEDTETPTNPTVQPSESDADSPTDTTQTDN
jgi:tubulin polyglutamylase TTLL4